ncbi:DNA polymerase III theta subunit [Klebsiella variicola]|nr:DNA polymerase III theta subunit [Klebsiella variicola]
MSKWNIASFSKEEQDKVSVDKAAAAVAWQERMNKPVVHELVERERLNIFASSSVNGSAYID